MNNPFIVATAAFLLLLPQLDNASAAGPYEGEWKGTARPIDGRCKRASVDFTVKGQVVLGQGNFDGDASSINGTVNESGDVRATIGFQFLRGQFSADKFQGTFKISDCQWEALLKRTTVGSRDVDGGSQTSGLKGR